MRNILKTSAPMVLAVATFWACNKRPVEGALPEPQVAGNQVLPQSQSRDLDILFVVDDSISMAGEQRTLLDNLDILMQALNSLQGGFPNAHIGVVSTDLGTGSFTSLCSPIGGDAGRLQNAPRIARCTPPGDPFINIENSNGDLSGNIANVDSPTADGLGCQGLVDMNGDPVPGMISDGMGGMVEDTAIDLCDIQAAFKCIAALGDDGCGFEMPLESARKALTCVEGEVCTNPGFRRGTPGEEAVLAIVFLGDEDDCSAKRLDLFNTTATATLGPPVSFRCFEYGVTCDPPIGRTAGQTYNNCRPKTAADVANPDDLYLFETSEYYDFFSSLGGEDRVILAGITGPYQQGDQISTIMDGAFLNLEPACTGPTGEAAPSVRLHDVIRRFGDNGVVLENLNGGDGICTSDYGPALTRLNDVIRSVLMPGCMQSPLIHETDDGPKLIEHPSEATCSVLEITGQGTNDEATTERFPCIFEGGPVGACTEASESPGTLADDSPEKCWYICDNGAAEVAGCDYRWQMRFCRDPLCDPATPAPADTDAYVQCLSCNPEALGCLCGDGLCQDGHKEANQPLPNYGENAVNCSSDCR